ncbi:hypothetical protein D7X33_29480 [Butyricicoccus sp. 1XD8-22]|nr:hypothetical protein D7X33_29480 [Butyricicoccus sp. 1XD8-22]
MKIIVESKVINEFILGEHLENYTSDYLEHEEKMNVAISEMENLDADSMEGLDDAEKIDILQKHASVTSTTTEILDIQVIESVNTANIGSSKNELFESWKQQVGYNKAVLLLCNYPLAKVMSMTDEEAESEVQIFQEYAEL